METEKHEDNDDFNFEITEEDIKELDERRRKRLNGENKTYTWEEAKAMLIKNQRLAITLDKSSALSLICLNASCVYLHSQN